MIILFSNYSPKINEYAFSVPNLRIFVFALNFATRQIQGFWFQIWQYFLQILAQKYPNKALLVPNLSNFIFHEILQVDKFEGADFKCDNSFFEIPVQQDELKDFKYDNCIFKL